MQVIYLPVDITSFKMSNPETEVASRNCNGQFTLRAIAHATRHAKGFTIDKARPAPHSLSAAAELKIINPIFDSNSPTLPLLPTARTQKYRHVQAARLDHLDSI